MSRQSVPKDETKQDKFERLAELRMQKALKILQLIGNLASPQYAYGQEHINQIVGALQDAIQIYVIDRFNRPVKTEKRFSFEKTSVNSATVKQQNTKK